MHISSLRPLFVGIAGPLLITPIAPAADWYVNADGSGDSPTIQAAVDGAAPADVIHLAGTFTGSGNRDVQVPILLTFRGPATIDCQASAADNHRGFALQANCVFEEIVIRNGHMSGNWSSGMGGAIYAAESVTAEIRGCRFEDNEASRGGALAFDSLDRAEIRTSGDIHVEDSAFLRNHADESGVVYLLGINLRFDRCRFTGNTADGDGGVTSFVHAEVHFTECLLEGNCAFRGGAVETGTLATFTRCSLVGNEAKYGAHLSLGSFDVLAEVDHCILAFGVGGDAVFCPTDGSSDVLLSCSDVFGNIGGDFTLCLEDEFETHGNFSADPLFCDPAVQDYTLHADSPCAPEAGSCGMIGAFGVGCDPLAIERSGWGAIKARYRNGRPGAVRGDRIPPTEGEER